MDVAGDNQLNVEHEMIKQRLSKHGAPIGKAGLEIIGEVTTGSDSDLQLPTITLVCVATKTGPAGCRRATSKLLR